MTSSSEILLASNELSADCWETRLSVPTMHCGGCISKVESALMQLDQVSAARVNLTRKFVDVIWSGPTAPHLLEAVSGAGHEVHIQDSQNVVGHETANDETTTQLIRAVAVAGFATSNIMLMSAAIWAGAGEPLKTLFHWASAAIALPTLYYSGRVFYQSAWSAVRHGQTNMDVPISIGIILTFSMSLYDTINNQGAVYFEASVMLLFFLLIGRALDHVMREKAQSTIAGMAKLIPSGALVVENGTTSFKELSTIETGETLFVAAGERIPLDGKVTLGHSSLDCSVVTGESLPTTVRQGSAVLAGTMNLESGLEIMVMANQAQSFLSQTVDMMTRATSSRTVYQPIADRAAQLYAPFVHSMALLAFIIWITVTGDWHQALTISIAVLIITCPCALGLAAPIVQVVAAQKLFEYGVLTRGGSALERMQEIDAIVFDKTGTLTEGRPKLCNEHPVDPKNLNLAAAIATHSSHPISQALVDGAGETSDIHFEQAEIEEVSGQGLEANIDGKTYRLGRAEWALSNLDDVSATSDHSEVTLSCDGEFLEVFYFEDTLRNSAKPAIESLSETTPAISLLSGDRGAPVQKVASLLNIKNFAARYLPGEKLSEIQRLSKSGSKVLMVGDGLNDAPALAAAHVSMAPSSAADIGRSNADFVFLNGDLTSIPKTIETAKKAGRLINQNFALAIAYNLVVIPFAMLGFVTPLIAAIAMSASSIIVVLNAFRLNLNKSSIGLSK